MSSNGLLSCHVVYASGSSDSNYFVTVGANGDSIIEGDLTLGGDITVTGITSLEFDTNIPDADISNTTGVITYTVDASAYPIYPSFIKVCPTGDITATSSITLIPEATLLVPMDGYYRCTAQVRLFNLPALSVSGDFMEIYLDISGPPLTPINGSLNIVSLTRNASNNMSYIYGGIIMTKLTKGQYVNMYHRERANTVFTSDSDVTVFYQYLGNNAI